MTTKTQYSDFELDSELDDDSITVQSSESVAIPLLIPRQANSTNRRKKKNNPGRTTALGLAIPIQQQLLQEIENQGGFEQFSKQRYNLHHLCDCKSDIYGERGSRLRRQVQDKVKNWKKLSPQEYQELASSLSVVTAVQQALTKELLSKEIPALRKQKSNLCSKKIAAPATNPTAPARISLKSSVQQRPSIFVPNVSAAATMNLKNSFHIQVNPDLPEANREAMVYELDRIEGVGEQENRLYKGYWICIPIDIRFILDDKATTHWKARIFSEDTVLLSIQAWPYSHLNDRDQFETRVSTNVIEAMDAAHHDYANEPADVKESRKWKHLYLKFPEGHQLTAKAINTDAGDDEKLKLELIPLTVQHKEMKTSYTTLYAAWKVARNDLRAKKKGKLEKKDDKSDAALLLEQLGDSLNACSIDRKRKVPVQPEPVSSVATKPVNISSIDPDVKPASIVSMKPEPVTVVSSTPGFSTPLSSPLSSPRASLIGDRKEFFKSQATNSKELRLATSELRQQNARAKKLQQARQVKSTGGGFFDCSSNGTNDSSEAETGATDDIIQDMMNTITEGHTVLQQTEVSEHEF